MPALGYNESNLVECKAGVTQCMYTHGMVTIYGKQSYEIKQGLLEGCSGRSSNTGPALAISQGVS